MSAKPTVNVYVDGFNLYNRALRNSPYKWLDLEKLVNNLLHTHEVKRLRYFTALIKARPDDPQAPSRQSAYLRALHTNPKITVHLGQFQVTKPYMPVHPIEYDSTGRARTVRVRKTEEKGSDVNIATYMLYDCGQDDADAYVVLTNDSDLAEPIRLMSVEMRKTVGIFFPSERPSNELLRLKPAFVRQIRAGALGASQLPDTLADATGEIAKPADW